MNKDIVIHLILYSKIRILKNLKEDKFMFNFSERTTGEKIVMIGAGALVIGNTVMNTVNTIKVKNLKKKVTGVENQIAVLNRRLDSIEASKSQQQVPQQPQDGGNQ